MKTKLVIGRLVTVTIRIEHNCKTQKKKTCKDFCIV